MAQQLEGNPMASVENSGIETEEQLIAQLTTPGAAVIRAAEALDGPVVILGAGGKMGPTLAELLARAGAEVVAVSRFSQPGIREYLQGAGVGTVAADLMEEGALQSLPDAGQVLLLAGHKFGSSGNPAATWAVNAELPGRVVARYRDARVVYVSSGNVYPFSEPGRGGSRETDPVGPVGEYAQSRLGGERLAEHAALKHGAALLTVRLFYATELRYGIIRDIAGRVHAGEPVDLTTGHVNQIWQGDANAWLARSFPLCSNPPEVLNMTGPEVLPVRGIAVAAGAEMGRQPVFAGSEAQTSLLGNAGRLIERLGPPEIAVETMIRWTARWVERGGRSLGMPTKYEVRSGRF